MSGQSQAPVIIKKVRKGGGDGHHGGAWKVAYADFVTAMMAFFMLMWLLNATTEKQRKGIADYFSPTIPVNRISGGGDGSFGGDSVFVEETLAQNGMGGMPFRMQGNDAASAAPTPGDTAAEGEAEALRQVEDALFGRGGESMASENALRHVVTRLTDEGLVIELFDLDSEPLFDAETATPTALTRDLTAMVAGVFALVGNKVALAGHVRARPVVLTGNRPWPLSWERAEALRLLLLDGGLAPERLSRVTGYGDQTPAAENPMAARNNRVEIILLRSDQPEQSQGF